MARGEKLGRARSVPELNARYEQQLALCSLMQACLQGAGAREPMQVACDIAAVTLSVPFSEYLDVASDGSSCMVAAGRGWRRAHTDRTFINQVDGEPPSLASLSLRNKEPIRFRNLNTTTRFQAPGRR